MLTPDQIRLRLRDGDDLADTCSGCTVVLEVLREVLPLLVAAIGAPVYDDAGRRYSEQQGVTP